MLSQLALLALAPAAHAQALTTPTVIDYSDNFDAYTNTTAFSGTGGWISQYGADRWAKATLPILGGILRSTTDTRSNGAGWGINGPQDNALVQTGNTCGPPALRTRPCAWATHQIDADFASIDNDGIGAVFGWIDNRNFWLFVMTRDRLPNTNGSDQNAGSNVSRLIHVVNGAGVETFNANPAFAYNQFPAVGHLTVLVEGTNLQVWVDRDLIAAGGNTRVFNVTPITGLPTGSMGVYSYEDGSNGGATFDNVFVRIPDTDKDTVADVYDNCPSTANTNQANLDGDALGDVCDADQDGDGVNGASGDCDDRDKNRFPGNTETCDGIDQNCNGIVDDGAAGSIWYADTDSDKYGDPASSKSTCVQPAGYVANNTDCNDKDATITDGINWYPDTDNDTYGSKTAPTRTCSQPPGMVADNTDCNDALDTAHPGGTEVCDLVDNDCNTLVDDAAIDAKTWYADADADKFGNAASSQKSCAQPAGTSANSTDCKDTDATAYPGAPETCDGVDDNCNGAIDDGAIDAKAWYTDADGDAHGDKTSSTVACAAPAGTVALGDDCLDTDKTAYPGAPETCDGVDDDCDGTIDNNATDAKSWYADADADTYGDGSKAQKSCLQPLGTADDALDCDDTRDTVNPAAIEKCNGLDDNCDGTIDNGATDVQTWYLDADHDGFGDGGTSTKTCTPPAGYVADKTDCNDQDAAVTGPTTWFVDADKDGLGDDNVTQQSCSVVPGLTATGGDCDDNDANVGGPLTWYADADVDGHGTALSTTAACAQPAGYTTSQDDCNDANSKISPDAFELCATAGVDDNCDGTADEASAVDVPTWYTDADADAFGTDVAPTAQCVQPGGTSGFGGDCNDADATYHPGAPESCTDAVDLNCDGSTGSQDVDADGTIACEDCDDSNPDAHPGGTEVCDGADNDCDGTFDGPDAIDADTWYDDVDGDQHGDAGFSSKACAAPVGAVASSDDCNDAAADVYPGAPETCADTSDKNCDGVVGNVDTDNDGFAACEECDDTNADINPDAAELCNGIDDNCAGGIDETGDETWYTDGDGDGFGDDTTGRDTCFPEDGEIDVGGDCDDTDPAINADAEDVPDDGIDQDCDGEDAHAGDTDTETGDTSDTGLIAGRYVGGCNCDSTSGLASIAWLGLLGALIRRRR